MKEHLERWLGRLVRPGRSRSALTPGDLYRRMSAEFRDERAPGHGGCVMPMVVFRHQSGREANWGVEALTSHCAECDRLAKRIARRYSIRFNLRDATQRAVGSDACSPEVVAAQ